MKNKGLKTLEMLLLTGMMIFANNAWYVTAEEISIEAQEGCDAEAQAKAQTEAEAAARAEAEAKAAEEAAARAQAAAVEEAARAEAEAKAAKAAAEAARAAEAQEQAEAARTEEAARKEADGLDANDDHENDDREMVEIDDYQTPLGLGMTDPGATDPGAPAQEENDGNGSQTDPCLPAGEEEKEAKEDTEEDEDEKKTLTASVMKVMIFTTMTDATAVGDVITLTSALEGFEDCAEVSYQWMCDKGQGFEPVPGATADRYSYTADENNLHWGWKLQVYFK